MRYGCRQTRQKADELRALKESLGGLARGFGGGWLVGDGEVEGGALADG
jgi:hypothetical protein